MNKQDAIDFINKSEQTDFCIFGADGRFVKCDELNETGKSEVMQDVMRQLQYEIENRIGFGELLSKILCNRVDMQIRIEQFKFDLIDKAEMEMSCLASNLNEKE